jgi:hypothetical protein
MSAPESPPPALSPRRPNTPFGSMGNSKLKPKAWPQALLLNMTNKRQKREKEGSEDGWLGSPSAPPFIGGARKGAIPLTSNRHPSPPIQEDRALALMLSCTMRLRYLPRAMHAAYVAKDKGMVGRVNWQFLPRALKSFTGHCKDGPTTIGYTRHTGKTETGSESRLMKKQRRLQEISLFSAPACAIIRTYPDDARQRDRGRPGGFCRCNKPWVCCPDCAQAREHDYKTKAMPRYKRPRSSKNQHAD